MRASKAAAGPTRGAGVYVALLRGINVGGKNKLPMTDLVQLFTDVGCRDVESYIQSGNVVFAARPALVPKLPDLVAERITADFGYEVPVVVRSAEEMAAVARANPFLRTRAPVEALHVAFLMDAPSTSEIRALDPKRSPPDTFEVQGREIYLSCPNGMGKTKLTNAYFDSKLGTVSTMRNWRTVLTLREMSAR